jgi:hypothetical protein
LRTGQTLEDDPPELEFELVVEEDEFGAGVGVETGVGLVAAPAQVGPEMVLASNVTSPVCARARPFNVAPLRSQTDVSAKIFPINEVVVSRVAELPTLHHTLQGSPPVTDEPVDVVSPDTVLKIQTPDPVRFKFLVSKKLPEEQ